MTRKIGLATVSALAIGWLAPSEAMALVNAQAPDPMAARCAALAGLRLPDTSIASAVLVPAKAAETTITGETPGYRSFCRVVARVRSAPDPTSEWKSGCR